MIPPILTLRSPNHALSSTIAKFENYCVRQVTINAKVLEFKTVESIGREARWGRD